MRVGIIGAGVCGLSAARHLRQLGYEVVVYEKKSSVGGRLSTRKQDGFIWDVGATSIAPRGKLVQKTLLEELDPSGLVLITKPIYTHSGLRISPGHSSGAPRYGYQDGIQVFAERLAAGLEVRLNQNIEGIERHGKKYAILQDEFDALILTPPIPQTTLLLWGLGESRPMGHVRYRQCLNISLGFSVPLPQTSYHALLDVEQIHPMTWLCLESTKVPGRAPEGSSAMVAQMGASFSLSQYDREDESLVQTAVHYVERLYGSNFQSPASWSVARWKYSQPESLASFENVNSNGSLLLVASDGLGGGHIEDAFDIGTRTAKLLVERLDR